MLVRVGVGMGVCVGVGARAGGRVPWRLLMQNAGESVLIISVCVCACVRACDTREVSLPFVLWAARTEQ
jgi:hypothetical protein